MDIGFTGSRTPPTTEQLTSLVYVLKSLRLASEKAAFHHGDCIGSDAIAHEVAKKLFYSVTLHPPTNQKERAFCEPDETREKKPYLHRNKDIVLDSDILLATPAEFKEVVRSGTWSTIRFARKQAIPRLIIFPDGTMSNEAVGILKKLGVEL